MENQKINLDNIEAIIFDLGGVILNLDYDLTINAFKRLGENQFEHLYSQANQDKIFDAFEIGSISAKEFVNYLSNLLPSSVSDQQIIDAWNSMLLNLPSKRLELLMELNNRLKLFLFSNTNELHFDAFTNYFKANFQKNDLLEDYFIKTYYSHVVGERKPNKSAFELVLKENNLSPEKVLFIDDSEQHIKGAQEVGIKTYHLVNTDILNIF